MSQVLLQVRIDRDLKERTASIYNAIGIDLPTAIRMFFKRSVMVGGLPFEGRLITRDNEAQRAFASMRQKIESAQEDDPTIDEINAMNTYRPSGAIGDKRNLLRGSHLLKAIFERLGGHLQTLPPQVG